MSPAPYMNCHLLQLNVPMTCQNMTVHGDVFRQYAESSCPEKNQFLIGTDFSCLPVTLFAMELVAGGECG